MKIKQSYISILAILMGLTVIPVPASAQEKPPALPKQSSEQKPPPLPVKSAKQYYFEEDNQKVGPLKLQQIRKHIKNGSIKRHTLVWKTGETNWSRAEYMLVLKDIFAQEGPAPEFPDEVKFKKYLVGVWEEHEGNENQRAAEVVSTNTYTYKSDGTYSAVATVYSPHLENRLDMEPIQGNGM